MIVLYAIAGAAVGGLLNLLIDRLPAGEALFRPRPPCVGCGRRRTALELTPVAGYLLQRGHCPSCGTALPRRILAVELLTSALFTFLWLFYGPGWSLLCATLYTCVLLLILFIDLERRLVLNRVTYPACGLAILVAAARSLPGDPLGLSPLAPTLITCLAGGLVGFLIVFLPFWVTRGGIGGGDVKLGALMGLMLGLPSVLAGLFLGFFAGGIGAIVVLATGIRGRRDAIPYAPYLAAGAWVAMLYGHQIIAWYVGRF